MTAPTTPLDPAQALREALYLSDRFQWAAPGDQQEDAWLVRFCDKDCGEAIFTGPDAEAEAWAYWNRYAPAFNLYVFRLAALSQPAAPAVDAAKIVAPFVWIRPHDERALAMPASAWRDGVRLYRTAEAAGEGAIPLYGPAALTPASAPQAAEGMVGVPREPTEAMWGGLARAIMMWLDMEPKTPRALFKHLERSGEVVPQWLRDEPEMQLADHVPSKGTRCVILYKAMLAAAPPVSGKGVAR